MSVTEFPSLLLGNGFPTWNIRWSKHRPRSLRSAFLGFTRGTETPWINCHLTHPGLLSLFCVGCLHHWHRGVCVCVLCVCARVRVCVRGVCVVCVVCVWCVWCVCVVCVCVVYVCVCVGGTPLLIHRNSATVSVCLGCDNKSTIHWLAWKQQATPHRCGGWKSKIKVIWGLLRPPSAGCVLLWVEAERPHPHDTITSQRPHLLIPSH